MHVCSTCNKLCAIRLSYIYISPPETSSTWTAVPAVYLPYTTRALHCFWMKLVMKRCSTYMCCVLLSKHPFPCKRPLPIYADSIVRKYMRYTYKWLLCVSAHLHFLACEFQPPIGYYLGEYDTCLKLELTECYQPSPEYKMRLQNWAVNSWLVLHTVWSKFWVATLEICSEIGQWPAVILYHTHARSHTNTNTHTHTHTHTHWRHWSDYPLQSLSSACAMGYCTSLGLTMLDRAVYNCL